ncbi:ankyrin repeat-containing domain protein [Russula aff. rugulosa BPL654]|nr:ankyrin repeat-containing domain protein [Russula aff. rugulosa BPL654]
MHEAYLVDIRRLDPPSDSSYSPNDNDRNLSSRLTLVQLVTITRAHVWYGINIVPRNDIPESNQTYISPSIPSAYEETVSFPNSLSFDEEGEKERSRDEYGWTPLLMASGGHNFKGGSALRLLLEHGADWAAFNGALEVGCLLLEHGADVEATNEYGKTALQEAAQEGHDEVVKSLRELGGYKCIFDRFVNLHELDSCSDKYRDVASHPGFKAARRFLQCGGGPQCNGSA